LNAVAGGLLSFLDKVIGKDIEFKFFERQAGRGEGRRRADRTSDSADASEAPSVGGKARYLQKPYSPTMLGRLLRQTLDQRNAESSAGVSKAKSTH
jgi:hypothetical protein